MALTDANKPAKHSIRSLMISALSGWVALVASDAINIFVIPHDPSYTSPLGPLAAFIIFDIIFSGFYIANFLLMAVPAYFYIRSRQARIKPWMGASCGALLFAISVPIWNFIVGRFDFDPQDVIETATIAAISGLVCFYFLTCTSQTAVQNSLS